MGTEKNSKIINLFSFFIENIPKIIKQKKNNATIQYFDNITSEKYSTESIIVFLRKRGKDDIPKVALTREIGVNYIKDKEEVSHYTETHLYRRYDIVIYIRETNALIPMSNRNLKTISKLVRKDLQQLLNYDYIY